MKGGRWLYNRQKSEEKGNEKYVNKMGKGKLIKGRKKEKKKKKRDKLLFFWTLSKWHSCTALKLHRFELREHLTLILAMGTDGRARIK